MTTSTENLTGGLPPEEPTSELPTGRADGLRVDVQALRALSVLLVVGFHLWPARVPGGFVGVDVFFVISGFLITTHLLREVERSGSVKLGRFWTRRAFRLLPASLLTITATLAAALIWVGEDRWRAYLDQALGSAFYIQNWVLAATATDYLGSSEPPTAFQHFWSLSVEEQFYLVFPVTLVIIASLTAKWRGAFLCFLLAVTAASLGWSMYLTSAAPAAAYFVSPTRIWEFGLGGLLACVGPLARRRIPPIFGWVGVAAILAAGLLFSAETPFPGYTALLPTIGAILVLAPTHQGRVFDMVAAWRPIQLVGDVSYSLYLWHWPLIVLAPLALERPLRLPERIAILLISLGISWLSTRYVETPLRLPHKGWRSKSGASIAVGMVISLALIGAGNAALTFSQQRAATDLDRARITNDVCFGAPALRRTDCPPPAHLTPDLSLLTQDDGNRKECWSTLENAEVHRCRLGRSEEPRLRLMAVGDSHNNSLIPAYERAAEQLGWQIDVVGKNGCFLGAPEFPTAGTDATSCTTWRASVLDEILTDPGIDAVVLTRHEGLLAAGADTKARRSNSEESLRRVWRTLIAAGKKVIVIEDVPQFPKSVIECVSTKGLDGGAGCAVPLGQAFDGSAIMAASAADEPGIIFVGMQDLYCTDNTCPAVIGGVPLFFNHGHLSATFARTLGPGLAQKLKAAVED